ncbi:MAG TPA: YbaN family protein [Candidatus Ruthenibacterium avium]|uniref:YbaN family protein n=1 Tax=Candidatus Ruthenibacterium avium TaxID=2838751 RepID=A0A9D2M287_9FIRM|nr:YbaN family protein [Candidatus Ruthenibacterium avium]
MKKIFYLIVGILSTALGAVGVVLPILPTTPFLLLAAFCFAQSSERLHRWFLSTKLYEKHLKDFVQTRAMTLKTKLSLMSMASAMMLLGFLMMENVPVGRIVIACVWVFHVYYFVFRIRTIPAPEKSR